MKWLKLAITVLVLAALGGGGYWWWKKRESETARPEGPSHEVERGELIELAAASGRIEPHVQVEVKSRASGQVIEILVEEGQEVKAGDLLVKLDPADAERALREARSALRGQQAQLSQARASLAVADLDRQNAQTGQALQERGVALGLVSSETVRAAQHTSGIAAANVELRRAQVSAVASQIDTARLSVEDAERRLTETKIYAPVDGTVLSVAVEKGSIVASALTNVSGGTPLLTLADLSDLRVVGAIDEAQIGRVSPHQPVVIRVDAYPERTFKGVVERVSPLGVNTNNVITFDVEIVVKDEHANLLRSGMSADLEIVTAEHQDALLVPLLTIQSEGSERYVKLQSGERRRIETGANDGTHIEVKKGLQDGDVVVVPSKGPGPAPQGKLPFNIGRKGR